MKLMSAALISIGILWAIDREFNGGKYVAAARSLVSQMTGGRL